ncbi:MAG: 5'-nucleotidase [Cellulomonas sp.]|uniref:5'-nucleotidase n=1 Tax=Cellulomonas sp. TaxID=40001 RepID=UPI00258BCFB2|nr:5'-nucleotidase [Cellulomonas sp.]MCR6703181.1 5'-nucleotidase [Cellulomonas sp.]
MSPRTRSSRCSSCRRTSRPRASRVLRSVEDHGLAIGARPFTAGEAPLSYVRPLNITLFLSGDEQDVQRATALDLPAGQVLGSSAVEADDGEPEATLRVAFDFDGVLADDEAERIWRDEGPAAYIGYERARRAEPLQPGPLRLPAGSRPDSGA